MDTTSAFQLVNSLSRFGMRFGLERTARVLEALGHPERRFEVLHVAGTNGKGSTCAFAARMLRCAGKKVALYTSPHLERVNERIQVDGIEISDEEFAAGVEAVLRVYPGAHDGPEPLTFFEFTTALALWHFARKQVDLAVLEVGLGGRLDATNAVPSKVAAVTRIGLDHTAILGPTLAAIASEKAAIFKLGARAVIARQPPEALAVLESQARAVGAQPLVAGRDFSLEEGAPYHFASPGFDVPKLALSLAGPHQRENAETAIATARLMVPALSAEQVRQGLASTFWPGRLERVAEGPLTLLDGAHNPDGARALAQAMRALYRGADIHLVFGALGDKDVAGIVSELFPLACRLYLACPNSERALSGQGLLELAAHQGRPAELFESVKQALERAREVAKGDPAALVLAAGSLYLVGEARASLRKPG